MNFDRFISSLLDTLPDNVSFDFPDLDLTQYLPADIDFLSSLKFIAIASAAMLVLGVIGRLFSGKRSALNHALSSAIGILFIYALTVVIYTFRPWNLDKFLSPLPLVAFAGDYLSLFPLQCGNFSAICYEIVSVLILAFLVNLLDTFIPKGDGVIHWYGLRFLSVALSMAAHIGVRWLLSRYLPDVLMEYAPMILLGVFAALFLLGLMKVVLGAFLVAVEPILGAIYTFFFSNLIGKQLTKAVITTVVITALVFVLEYLGIFLICISQAALVAFVPFLIALLLLWYLIGHIL